MLRNAKKNGDYFSGINEPFLKEFAKLTCGKNVHYSLFSFQLFALDCIQISKQKKKTILIKGIHSNRFKQLLIKLFAQTYF